MTQLIALVLALGIFAEPSGYAFSLAKRESSPPLPATVYVPITFDAQNRRYTVNTSLPSGSSQSQNQASFASVLTTSTGYSSVTAQECSTCGGSPTLMGPVVNVSIPEGGVSGPIITTECNLKMQNGSSWSWSNASVIVANQSSSIFSQEVPGLFGLGTNSREGKFNETPMAFWLKNNPNQRNFSFGLALNLPNGASSSDGGTLHWIAPDENSYQGPIAWKTLSSAPSANSNNSINADSFVEMDGWVFQSNDGVNVSDAAGDLFTVVDPLLDDLIFPQTQTRAIYATIPGSARQASLGGFTAYSLPCDTKMQLTLTFGTVSTTLNEVQLVRNLGNSTCIGALTEWASESVTEYFLGSSLISNIYLIFQGSDQGSSFGFANRKAPSSPLNGASIAGVVLGSLAFLIMLIIAIILFLRWRRKQIRKKIQAYPFFSPSSPGSATSSHFLLPHPRDTTDLFAPAAATGWLSDYVLTPAGIVATANGSSANNTGRVGDGKRNMRTLERMRLASRPDSVTPSTPSVNQNVPPVPSYHTDNLRNSGLAIRVVPPPSGSADLANGYTVIQQTDSEETDQIQEMNNVERGPFLRTAQNNSMNSVATLPPYSPSDPDLGARHRMIGL